MEKEQIEAEYIAMIKQHQGIVHKVCNMYCQGDKEDKQDLFQEILIQLWKAYPSFRHESKISTWMYRVALNTAISNMRKQKNSIKKVDIAAPALKISEVEYDYEYEEKLKFLNQAIEQLNDIEKAIVMLYLEEKSYEEISEIVGITPNYVGVKMNRIKEKLKKMIKN
ncbi:MAG: sigma-70 family RNA polymerase sigma factor [Microscillaceae bacterium]|nr:sigma-70 family RNA polymerase sigma factor [Microscillaceae bacterium]MDW8461081.1 sigma-70 family RNA polymerase sigma factor [Cytophagales bacterium]